METGDPSRPFKRSAQESYPPSEAGATPLFERVLRPLLQQDGALPFSRFMELALYHEDHGYYSDPTRHRVGRTGDFATNVSVGPAFGHLLARRLQQVWESHDKPTTFPVLELGPEDGSLALDILHAAREIGPDFHHALHYIACDPQEQKRKALAARFALSPDDTPAIVRSPVGLRYPFGAVIANEVLDALPVRLVRRSRDSWVERLVSLEDGALGWTEAPVREDALGNHLQSLPGNLPEGYQTEVCLQLTPFFHELSQVFDTALHLFIDYGFERDDYYHPDRNEGTLQTYAHHQAGTNPLESPGQRDLTTHVDFTSTVEAARQSGLRLLGCARQESYLTTLAAPFLTSLPDNPATPTFIRQFRTLTHPGLFGSRFHVLELTQGAVSPLLAFPCPNQLHTDHH